MIICNSTTFQGSEAMGKLNTRAKAGDDILKVGITSSCTGDAVSKADVSGCFRKTDGDVSENLMIEVSAVLVPIQLRILELGRRFGKCNRGSTSLENSCWFFNCSRTENVRTGNS